MIGDAPMPQAQPFPSACRGQSMTEFIIVLPILLLLVFGAIQFGLIYHAKATLNLAAFEAARAGALNRGNMAAMKLGLANGLRPLLTHGNDSSAVIAGFDRAKKEAGYPNDAQPTVSNIEVINPGKEATEYWKGHIPNDNLLYARDATPSGMSLQDANILKIKVRYCYPLQVLLVRKMITEILSASAIDDPLNCLGANQVPIVAQGIVRMQTDYCPAC